MKAIHIPQYVHQYSVDNRYTAFLNALTLDVLYCKKELLCKDEISTYAAEHIVPEFYHKGMALSDPSTEQQIIDSNIKQCHTILNRDEIKFLYIVPTVQCNLNCTYCHIQHGKAHQKKAVMSESTLINGLEIFKKYGGFQNTHSEIMYYGGEPFLAGDFLLKSLDTIRSYSESIKITIFTNGTLIDDKLAKKLIRYNPYVIVSMDGRAPVHDRARITHSGGTSFSAALKGYQALYKNGIDVGISLVAGSHNIETLEDEVLFIADALDPLDIGISTLHLFPDAKNPNEVDILCLTEKLQNIQRIMRKKGVYVEHLFRKIRPFVEKGRRYYDCPSCNSKLLITPWDTIGFCEAFMETEQYFYSTKDFSLDHCPGRNEWKQRIPLTQNECYSCPAINLCGGGCPYDAYCESGSIRNKDQRRCYQTKEIVHWLCHDLYDLLTEHGKLINQDLYTPSISDREMLYGKIRLSDDIPLQNYSKSNEESDKYDTQ